MPHAIQGIAERPGNILSAGGGAEAVDDFSHCVLMIEQAKHPKRLILRFEF